MTKPINNKTMTTKAKTLKPFKVSVQYLNQTEIQETAVSYARLFSKRSLKTTSIKEYAAMRFENTNLIAAPSQVLEIKSLADMIIAEFASSDVYQDFLTLHQ